MSAGDAVPARAPDDPAAFIRANTLLQVPRLLPELRLYLASEMMPLWQATEEELAAKGVPPPYWAFAWAGGQALARYLLDRPETVRGKRILDFAAGSGVAGVAAALAGACHVEASEIDAIACAAVGLNAAANDVTVELKREDVIGVTDVGWDVVLAGDVCYEQPMASLVEAWLKSLARSGTVVLLGDPKRNHLPSSGLEKLDRYTVPTTRELEDSDLRNATVWRVCG
ncbi:class I SAM-dependent methyltransferase [Ferruginivarius sediminum]|nr:50S ribosomal protein L11 methyltransferase [Ferruginivarius sediminum]